MDKSKYRGLRRLSLSSDLPEIKQAFRLHKPIIITDFSKGWKARDKWTFDFLMNSYGDNQVALYNDSWNAAGGGYMRSFSSMKWKEYLPLVRDSKTINRMFLYNIARFAKAMKSDVLVSKVSQTLGIRFNPLVWYTFVGAKNSTTNLHFDIDMADVFHTEFWGKKTFYLFSPQYSRKLYRHPFRVGSYIDPENWDSSEFPAFADVKGYKVTLDAGDTLYIPSGWWHGVYYHDMCFALALRHHRFPFSRIRGIWNIGFRMGLDKTFNAILGSRWLTVKKKVAKYFAEEI